MRRHVALAAAFAGLAALAVPAHAQMQYAGRAMTNAPAPRFQAAAVPSSANNFKRFAPAQGVAPGRAVTAQASSVNPPHYPEHVGSDGFIGIMPLWNAAWGWPYGYFGCGFYLVTFSSDVAAAYPVPSSPVTPAPAERSAAFRTQPAGDPFAEQALAAVTGVLVDLR